MPDPEQGPRNGCVDAQAKNHTGGAVKALGCGTPPGAQLVTVYSAGVMFTRPWARCQGSEVKGEGPPSRNVKELRGRPQAQVSPGGGRQQAPGSGPETA